MGENRTPGDMLIPDLPNAIAISCIARVPRSNHLSMSGVCQSWRKLLHGTVLSNVRRNLSLAENWLYLCIEPEQFVPFDEEIETCNTWRCFDPCLKKWSKLPTMPEDNRLNGHYEFASYDGKIFVIGGYFSNEYNSDRHYVPSRTVSYFDARSFSWKRAADLNIARANCMVGIIDNQLYVFGGDTLGGYYRTLKNTETTVEVYDSIMDEWQLVSSTKLHYGKFDIRDGIFDSAVMGGKFYAVNNAMKGIVYDARANQWEHMAEGLENGWKLHTTVWNGKLYTLEIYWVDEIVHDQYIPRSEHRIQVYNPKNDTWEQTEEIGYGKEIMPDLFPAKLVNLGENLCIVTYPSMSKQQYYGFYMVLLEVEQSTENSTCLITVREEFRTEFEQAEDRNPRVRSHYAITL